MNYKEMSDFEINKLVAEGLGYTYKQFKIFSPDYCNNPSEAWPIILENKISITCSICGSFWEAERHFIYKDKNPLRAAMIVYLMTGEGDELHKS